MSVYRIYVEKKPEFSIEAKSVFSDVKSALRLDGLECLRIINRYDAEGLSDDDFVLAVPTVFSEPAVDRIFAQLPEIKYNDRILRQIIE